MPGEEETIVLGLCCLELLTTWACLISGLGFGFVLFPQSFSMCGDRTRQPLASVGSRGSPAGRRQAPLSPSITMLTHLITRFLEVAGGGGLPDSGGPSSV